MALSPVARWRRQAFSMFHISLSSSDPFVDRLPSGGCGVAGDDHELLEREIGIIQELLDEQPDSKCEPSPSYTHSVQLS